MSSRKTSNAIPKRRSSNEDDGHYLDDLDTIESEQQRLSEVQVGLTQAMSTLSERRDRVIMAEEERRHRGDRLHRGVVLQDDRRTNLPLRRLRVENAADEDAGEMTPAAKRVRAMTREFSGVVAFLALQRGMARESASPEDLQHGRFSGTGSSALRPAAVDRPRSAAFWISTEAWPQPVCVVDGDALADSGLLSHASNLLHAYSCAVGLENYATLIQTDLEEDKTVLDAIAAAGQWHADRPPFSFLGEIGANGENKGL
jgi:hypothetical protein